jgi:tripartite-type tricarboxylate transporter receptor subunit TctC
MGGHMRFVRLIAAVAVALGAISGQGASAQDFPTKSISLITPYTAGGPYDILSRFMSEALRKQKLSQSVIVEAKPGGNTLIGIQHVLKAPADGHTLLISTLPINSNLILMKNPGYKYEDFVAVGPVARHPYILFVPATLPVSNLAELVAYAEKNPNKLNIGALSPGGQVQLLADRFLRASKLKIEKIPYKGAAELATALLTGDIQMSFFAYSAGAPFLKDGKLKPIAIATEQRSTLTPDIPTFKELGMPTVNGEAWVALFARSDTPKPVIAKLQAMITEASKDPEYVEKIRNAGNDPWVVAPDKIDDQFKADFKNWEADLRMIEPQ